MHILCTVVAEPEDGKTQSTPYQLKRDTKVGTVGTVCIFTPAKESVIWDVGEAAPRPEPPYLPDELGERSPMGHESP